MRTKKNGSMRKRKYGNKKSNKSKKCGCGVKLPFLKWGGDNPNGATNDSGITGKFNSFFTNIKKASNETTAKLGEGFNDLTNSTKSVFNDTKNQITETTKGILDNAQKNTSEFTNKAKGLVTNVYDTTTSKIGDVINKNGSFPSTPKKDIPTTSSLSNSSKNSSNKTTSTISSNSSKSNQSNSTNYTTNAIKKRRDSLNTNNNSGKQQGGKRRSSKTSKRHRSRKNVKSKTKRRKHIYKHKGGSGYMDGPLGIEKSSLAFTASPISNIKAVAPSADQMYGQTPYPAWRFSE